MALKRLKDVVNENETTGTTAITTTTAAAPDSTSTRKRLSPEEFKELKKRLTERKRYLTVRKRIHICQVLSGSQCDFFWSHFRLFPDSLFRMLV